MLIAEEGAFSVVTRSPDGRPRVTRMALAGAPAVTPVARSEQSGRFHFFFGIESSEWVTDARSFAEVVYPDVVDGLDLVLRVGDVVHCLAEGAPDRRVLLTRTDIGTRSPGDPLIQGPIRSEVSDDTSRAWFVVETVDENGSRGTDLVQATPAEMNRPGADWSTYFGGNQNDEVDEVAVGRDGSVTFVGNTYSPDFPVTPGSFDPVFARGTGVNARDAFVCRLDAAGELIWCTFLGGTDVRGDWARAEGVATNGDVVVGGDTASATFPTTPGAIQRSLTGTADMFVTRLTSDGSRLVYSTLLGSSGSGGFIERLHCDSDGEVILGGRAPLGFPTTAGAFQSAPQVPGFSGYPFVARLDETGSSFVFSTYITGDVAGGSVSDMAVGRDGRAVIVGQGSAPYTPGAIQDSGGPSSGLIFVTSLAADGASLVFSGSLGGSQGETARAVALDAFGNIVVVGSTQSQDFPVTADAWDPVGPLGPLDGPDGFVAVIDPTGSEIVYGSYLGASFSDDPDTVTVDGSGAIVIGGSTTGSDFPTTDGAFDTDHNPGVVKDLFVTRLSPDRRRLEYSTYLGGADDEDDGGRVSLATVPTGGLVVVSSSRSTDYPTTPGAAQGGPGGLLDGVVSKLTLLPAGASRYGRSTPGCTGPLVIGLTASPRVGNPGFAVTCTEAPPDSTSGLLALSLAAPGTSLPLLGAGVWVDPGHLVRLLPLRSDSLGYAELALPLAHDPGVPFYLQAFWPDACAPGGWSATAGLRLDIQP